MTESLFRSLLRGAEVRRRISGDLVDIWASRLACAGVVPFITGAARPLGGILDAAGHGVRDVSGALLRESPRLVQSSLNPLSTLVAIRQRPRSSRTGAFFVDYPFSPTLAGLRRVPHSAGAVASCDTALSSSLRFSASS